ncbi:MAG: hypothetical protein ACLGI8_10155 [Acidimicrobiia bacterium]|jgi:hypothetical protein
MRQPVPPASRSLRAEADRCGFRRVHHVSIRTVGRRATAAVTGVLHRYPVTVPVSMATATRLVGAGAPVRFERGAEPR